MMKKHIPGPTKGSYMSTDMIAPVVAKQYEVDGCYAIELRGLWKLENDFMGGPFVNLSVLDQKNNRIVCVDGYVYAPGEDKRNLIRQVEAIMHTLSFPKEEKEKK